MKLAVISDTHDHQNNILRAISIMNERKADILIHCGDYCSAFTRRWFNNLNQNLKENFYGVFGNNDGDHFFLRKNLGQICKFAENGHEIIKEIDGKRVFASHMPRPETIEALAKSGNFDIILSGHTHVFVNKKYNNDVLVVNPGEVCGYLTGKSSFALIDTSKLEAEIIFL
ncbi:MAG: metallophosphoesterase [Promethearchaeota archaeon]